MDNVMIVLITVFAMMYLVNLMNGNMIGRRDGVRANSNCMVCLPHFLGALFFLSNRKGHNLWSRLSQHTVFLYVCFSGVLQLLKPSAIIEGYRPILISFVAVVSVLYLALFIDVMIYDRRYRNRY